MADWDSLACMYIVMYSEACFTGQEGCGSHKRYCTTQITCPIVPDSAYCCRRAGRKPERGSAPAARLRHQEPRQGCSSEPSPSLCDPGWHRLCVSSGYLRGAGCPSHCLRGERNFLCSFWKHGMCKQSLLVCLQSPCKRVFLLPMLCPPFCGRTDAAMQLA